MTAVPFKSAEASVVATLGIAGPLILVSFGSSGSPINVACVTVG